MTTFLQDIRYGVRMLAKNPAFTIVAILTLAIGIGANTAIFSVVNTVLLRPLPHLEPDDLVLLFHDNVREGIPQEQMSWETFTDFREQADTLEPIAGISPLWTLVTPGPEGPERIPAYWVSATFFPTLGARPLHGRIFTAEEDAEGKDPTVVLSHHLWASRFDSDPTVIGESITLTGQPTTIIGVMPPGFGFMEKVDAWMPLSLNPLVSRGRPVRWITGLGRLAPGASLETAESQMETIAGRIAEEHPDSNNGLGATVVRLQEHVVGDSRAALVVLMGVVGFVLMIACANVANLLMARAAARESEVAVRRALGAGRWRLVRQFLTESLVLALSGGAAGLVLAFWGLDLIRAISPASLPRLDELAVDSTVLVFTLVATLATGFVFGLVPALQVTRTGFLSSLKEGGRALQGTAGGTTRRVLVVGEVALALVLLVGSGLMIRSFAKLLNVDPGFDPGNLLTMQMGLPGGKYDAAGRIAFYNEVFERIEGLPGVRSAGATTRLPLRTGVTTQLDVEGQSLPPAERPQVEFRRASTGYFRAMGIPLIRGRFDEELAESQLFLVVNESAARRFWPGEDPVGRRARPFNPDPNAPWWMIAGVVGDVKHFGLDSEARPEVYMHFSQGPPVNPLLAIRTDGDPALQLPAVRATLRSIEPELMIYNVSTMSDLVSDSVAERRFNMLLLGGFAGVALILAAIGIYGVLSYMVRLRTHEIGIRMALGAQKKDILSLMVNQGMRLTLAGVAVGIVVSAGLTRLMASLLFGVSAVDPMTYLAVPLVLAGVSLFACYLPARRASRVDPMIALHYE